MKTFDHNSTKFPLKGSHQKVECLKCHKKEAAPKLQFDWCGRCHEDQHGGQFSAGNGWMDCARCHSERQWKPSLFDLDQHSLTQFTLGGAHTAIPCFLCHKPAEELQGKIHYTLGKSTCTDCHKDEHNGQFNKNHLLPDCKKCHNLEGWEIPSFNHSETGFPLDGKHQTVACQKCHKPATTYDMKTGNELEIIKYKPLPHDCIDCHRKEFEKQ